MSNTIDPASPKAIDPDSDFADQARSFYEEVKVQRSWKNEAQSEHWVQPALWLTPKWEDVKKHMFRSDFIDFIRRKQNSRIGQDLQKQ